MAEIQRRERILLETAELLGAPMEKVKLTVANNLDTIRELRRQLESLQRDASRRLAAELLKSAETIGETRVMVEAVDQGSEFLIEVGNALNDYEIPIVASMHSASEPRLVVTANRNAVEQGVDAGKLANEVSKMIGGGGGGKPHLGQGGGGDVEKFKKERERILKVIKAHLGKKKG
jgi:alanyl-tRNA synthetase